MVKCCAEGCNNHGTHLFPKTLTLRKLWEKAVSCGNGDHFKASQYSKLCSDHFKPDDYHIEGYFSGLPNTRKVLRKGTVPSVFSIVPTSFRIIIKNGAVARHKQIVIFKKKGKLKDEKIKYSNFEDISSDKVERNLFNEQPQQHSISTQINYCFCTVERFKNNNEAIEYYTGFSMFKTFDTVYHLLCPEATNICYNKSQKLKMIPEDQLFLTLMKLRKNKDNFELSLFFDINIHSVDDIFKNWINLMYEKWKNSNTCHLLKENKIFDLINKNSNNELTSYKALTNNTNKVDKLHNFETMTSQQIDELASLYAILQNHNRKCDSEFTKLSHICNTLYHLNELIK